MHSSFPLSTLCDGALCLGGGLFIAIAPFSGSLFDRLVAASHTQGTSVFLVFFADGLACEYQLAPSKRAMFGSSACMQQARSSACHAWASPSLGAARHWNLWHANLQACWHARSVRTICLHKFLLCVSRQARLSVLGSAVSHSLVLQHGSGDQCVQWRCAGLFSTRVQRRISTAA